MAETTRWWVGIDWAMVDHQVCVWIPFDAREQKKGSEICRDIPRYAGI